MIYSWTLLYQNNNNKSRKENINSNFPCGIEYNFFISFFLYFFFTCEEVSWLTSSLMWIFLLKISKGNFLRWLFFISLETWHQIIACIYLCLRFPLHLSLVSDPIDSKHSSLQALNRRWWFCKISLFISSTQNRKKWALRGQCHC